MLPWNMGEKQRGREPGILNETTGTVHKRDRGGSSYQSQCGVTYHVDAGRLRATSVERATRSQNVTKCGRCFADGGGY